MLTLKDGTQVILKGALATGTKILVKTAAGETTLMNGNYRLSDGTTIYVRRMHDGSSVIMKIIKEKKQ